MCYPIHILEAALAGGCRRLVNTGTQSQHRDGTADYAPTNLYAASKQAFEDLVCAYVEYEDSSSTCCISRERAI
jgi:nucleoside-diphosphate-sugar epimerase